MKKDLIKIILINLITLTRLIGAFTLPFIFVFKGAPIGAIVTIILFATDWIDGLLARKLNACTLWGAGMDALCDKLLNICSFSLLGSVYNKMLLPLLIEIAIMYTNYSSYRYGGNVKSTKIGKIKTVILDVLVILSFCIIGLQVFNSNSKVIIYLINKTPELINLFSCIITVACLVALIDYVKRNKEVRKNPKSEKAKKEIKHLKPFKQLMNDLLDTEYYKKHKEESIIKQFYT